MTQTKQNIPDFFGGGFSAGACGMADKYGGSDIRQPIAAGAPQKDEEDWWFIDIYYFFKYFVLLN